MELSQAITIVLTILMLIGLIGFGWIIIQIEKLKTRVNIIERILAMKGEPIKSISHDELE